MKVYRMIAGVGLFLAFVAPRAQSELVEAINSGDWFDTAVWNTGVLPQADDDVVIPSGKSVVLSNSPPALMSLVNAGTLTFTNWNTTLTAVFFTVSGSGTVTHVEGYCASNSSVPTVSNRVAIVCYNLIVTADGSINVDTKGYYPSGPGHAGESRGGGCYGGLGGLWPGTVYGSLTAPTDPGSAGGAQLSPYGGGKGGGAILIEAGGAVIVDGTITANGGLNGERDGFDCGGGSGGSVYITCDTVRGTGTIRANGAIPGNTINVGGGGGGRIAIHYNTARQSALTPKPVLTISSAGGAPFYGNNSYGNYYGQIGTVYLTDAQILPETMTTNFNGLICNVTAWAPNSLTCSGLVSFAGPARISVTNDVLFALPANYVYRPAINLSRLTAGGNVRLDNVNLLLTNTPLLTCGQNLTLDHASTITVYAGPTNVLGPDYGALVQATGDLLFATTNCWIYPQSYQAGDGSQFMNATAGSALFRMRNLTIPVNAGFNADARGFKMPYTPGWGGIQDGGAYGGRGGRGWGWDTVPYGSSNAPVEPGGSGGGWNLNNLSDRQAGGGSIRIEASRTVRIDGLLTANGEYHAGSQGGGAGGGIYIRCRTFAGAGVARANGANAGQLDFTYFGGGGGGRIAVWRADHQWTGDLSWPSSVTNGLGGNPLAQPGTLVWGQLAPAGTVFIIH